MNYTIQDLQNDLTGILHQTQMNQIFNLYGVIYRAAGQLLLDMDPQETKRTLEFVNPIFNGVYEYPIAADVKGNKIIDIRPQVRRLPRDVWSQAYNQDFDIYKQNIFGAKDMFTMNFNTGLKTLRINAPFLNPPIIVNQADNLTDNGTWAVGGTGSNLTVDNINYVQGVGSLKFDATVGISSVTNSTMSTVNLSNYVNQSSFFVWIYAPTGSALTSVSLVVGSSAANNYSLQITQNQTGTSFINGWNLCQFDWKLMGTNGTPDSSAVNYVKIVLTTTGTNTGLRVNGIDSILGSILEYEYYSKYLFRDAITGAFQERPLDPADIINLDTESYNLLLNQVAYLATQQQQGADSGYDANFFKNLYDKGVQRYKDMYKSEVQKPQSVYYAKPYKGYGQYFGGNNY